MRGLRALAAAILLAGIASDAPAQHIGTFGGAPVMASATGTTAGATATLPAVAGKTTYICGFAVAPGSATAAITIDITVTGLAATLTYKAGAPVTAVGVTGAVLTQNFSPCIGASAPNTTIPVAAGALGAGGVNQTVQAWGYQAP